MKKSITAIILVMALLHGSRIPAVSDEAFSIDDKKVLLYKIINWWNDSLPENSELPCGLTLKYTAKNEAHVIYDETKQMLSIEFGGNYQEILSIFKQCHTCLGPSSFQARLINREYLGEGKPVPIDAQLFSTTVLVFEDLTAEKRRLLLDIERDLHFEIIGRIGGLLLADGRVALHQAGVFLRVCPQVSSEQAENTATLIRMIDSSKGEVIVEYSAVLTDE